MQKDFVNEFGMNSLSLAGHQGNPLLLDLADIGLRCSEMTAEVQALVVGLGTEETARVERATRYEDYHGIFAGVVPEVLGEVVAVLESALEDAERKEEVAVVKPDSGDEVDSWHALVLLVAAAGYAGLDGVHVELTILELQVE